MNRLYDLISHYDTNTAWKNCLTLAVFSGTCLLTHSVLGFLRGKKYAGNLPPGLPSVPFIGSLPFMPPQDEMHIFFMEKAREFGPVVKFHFPTRLGVFINGRDMIYEAFVKQSLPFANRPDFISYAFFNTRRKGFLGHPYDSEFRKYHQLSLNILTKFGFGKGIMENRIHVEVEDLLANIRKLNGNAVCADRILSGCVSNVIVSILFGERYADLSPELTLLNENAHKVVCVMKDVSVIDFLPVFRFLPKYRRCLREGIEALDELLKHMNSKIDAGLQGELPESFITHFLEMEGAEFDREQLLFTLRDLLLAGTETSATTLQWALILLANHPDIQERLHMEIDSVVSMDRLPALEDKKKLPFTEALILEVLRIRTTVPLGLPHETLYDTWLNGYLIPKGTLVLPNLYSAHMDPAVWQDPHNFNPERFLDGDGNITNKDAVISFSMGRRSCLGEILAQQELFLFLSGLVQHFDIRPPDGQSTVVYKTFVGITMAPTDYKIRLLPRCK